MDCKTCHYRTNNIKSFSNHIRFGCNAVKKSDKACRYCKDLIPKRKPSEQGIYCNNKCYSLWRSENLKGEKAPNFIDGRCGERLLLRAGLRLKNWRRKVFRRDGYTCQNCGDNSGGNLEAHHIKSFAKYSKSRFIIKNGITLCKKCHKETKNYGFKKANKI